MEIEVIKKYRPIKVTFNKEMECEVYKDALSCYLESKYIGGELEETAKMMISLLSSKTEN